MKKQLKLAYLMATSDLKNIKRRLFVILDKGLVCDKKDRFGTHGEWFREEGWTDQEELDFIERHPRGYVDDEGIFIYQGRNARLPEVADEVLVDSILKLTHLLNINDSKCVFLGGRKGTQGANGKLEPIMVLGPINKIIS